MTKPFYYSLLDEYYPKEYAFKICAWCGGPIVYDKGISQMFCSDNCATEYWKFEPEALDADILKGTTKCYLKQHGLKRLSGPWKCVTRAKILSEGELVKALDGDFNIINENWRLAGCNHNALLMEKQNG